MTPHDKEIIEKFGDWDSRTATMENIQEFILSSLSLQRQKIREGIERLGKFANYHTGEGEPLLKKSDLLQSDILKDE